MLQIVGPEASTGMRTTTYPEGPRSHRGDRLFRNLLSRKFPGEEPTTHNRIGYAAAQVVVEGLERAGKDLTRESFINALESLENWTGGVLPSISYSEKDHYGLVTMALQRAINGRWVIEVGKLRVNES
jgi:hypothetical protein